MTERQRARHARVIEATIELASDGGYDAVQMRDVAAHAEVALGTLYRYFSSKDHLLVAALGQWTSELQERLQQRPPQGTDAERVIETLRRATRAMDREPALTKAFISALASLTSEDDAALARAEEVYATIAEMINDALADGRRDDHRDQIRVLSHVWFASLLTWVRGWNSSKEMLADLETAVRLLFR